ncbi:MAG: ATP-binding protein [Dehalococcoidia bacterium]
MFGSIQWRIAISYVLLILISMGVLGFFLVNFVEDKRIDDLRSQLEAEARLVGESSLRLSNDGAATSEIAKLANTLGQKIDARVTIISTDGTVLGDSEENPVNMENHATRPEVREALATGFGESTRYSSTLRQRMMYVAVPFERNGSIAGIARVALPTAKIDDSMNQLKTTIGLVVGIVALIVILMALYLARVTTKPIKAVTAAAKRISLGEIDQKIYTSAKDETAELASAFNEMAQNLKSMIGDWSTQTGKLTAVLNTMDAGVVMTDIEGAIIMANPAAGKLFDFGAATAAGRRLLEIIPDYEVNELFKAYLRTGQPQSRQIEQPRTGRLLRVIASRISYHESVGVLLMFQDLTEVRRLQTIRQRFIANISHELRTPLASIKAVTDTLSDGIVNDPEIARSFLARIDVEIDRMTQIIRELSELSRIESGQIELKLAPLKLVPVIEECISRIKPQSERKQIVIETSLKTELPPVQAESERIQQVLLNLLHNAVKFTPEGGTITVSATTDDNSVIVSVADTGIGIMPQDLPHIFERFYKADKSRSTEGTGLGLAIAKHIIQAHGGQIWAMSEPDQGSVFSFRLPQASHL